MPATIKVELKSISSKALEMSTLIYLK